jgi:hypothetical protein
MLDLVQRPIDWREARKEKRREEKRGVHLILTIASWDGSPVSRTKRYAIFSRASKRAEHFVKILWLDSKRGSYRKCSSTDVRWNESGTSDQVRSGKNKTGGMICQIRICIEKTYFDWFCVTKHRYIKLTSELA